MAAATSVLLDRLDTLVALFNRGSLDLPDGARSRDAIGPEAVARLGAAREDGQAS